MSGYFGPVFNPNAQNDEEIQALAASTLPDDQRLQVLIVLTVELARRLSVMEHRVRVLERKV